MRNVQLVDKSETLAYFLAITNPSDLPTPLPKIIDPFIRRRLYFRNLFKAGMNAFRVNIVDGVVTKQHINFLKDILIVPTETSGFTPAVIQSRFLFMVNNKIFIPKIIKDKIFLQNAAVQLDRYRSECLSVIDFVHLGGFSMDRIDSTNMGRIKKVSNTLYLVELNITKDISNKSVALIINGNLYMFTKNYTIIDTNTIVLQLDVTVMLNDLIETELETVKWVDHVNNDRMGMDTNTINIQNYLTAGSSAIVFINEREVCTQTRHLGHSIFEGRFRMHGQPHGIFYYENGEMGHYDVTSKTGVLSELTVSLPTKSKLIRPTVPAENINVVDNSDIGFFGENLPGMLVDYYVVQ
jgi:hypothetical protein